MSVFNDTWMMIRGYDQNKKFLREIGSHIISSPGLNKLENVAIPSNVFYVEFGFQSGVGSYAAQPMLVFSGSVGAYAQGNYNNNDSIAKLQLTSNQFSVDIGKAQSTADTANTAIGNLAVGGRNYVLNSSGENASAGNWPNVQGGRVAFSSVNVFYGSTDIGLSYTGTGTQEWYYGLVEAYANASDGPLVVGNTYSFSVDVKGTVPSAAFRISNVYTPSVAVNNTSWTRLIYTGVLPAAGGTGKYYIRLNAMNGNTNGSFTNGQSLRFRHFKIESGTLPTDWTPAPEDVNSAIIAVGTAASTADGKAVVAQNLAAQLKLSVDSYSFGIASNGQIVSVCQEIKSPLP